MKSDKEIRKFIKDITQDVRSMSYEQLTEACNEFFPRIPILPLDFNNQPFFFRQNEYGGRNAIYRGRKITNSENQPHLSISEISFIQKKDLNKIEFFGRVNKKGESMFYGAIGYPTTCIETLSKGIELKDFGSAMVTVGTWLIKDSIKMVQLPYSKKYWQAMEGLTRFNLIRMSSEKINEENNMLRGLVETEIDFEILQLFGDAFANFNIECEQDYYLSNYYKDRIFNQVKGFNTHVDFEAILYPSVSNAFESDNIVIRPSTVEKKMEFLDAMLVWVVNQKQSGGSVQFIPIKQRIYPDKNGIFKWW